MQSQHLARALPSPPGSHFPHTVLPPPGPAAGPANQAAHTSHLQDLQHQISTKTLALQTLQREHDQLLAAFSRSQIRCNTLDKKSQVSDHEINSLTEEKIRLQQQVEMLEAQVEDLAKARDEVQKQSSADGAQWRQIVAMSSQLQMKSAEEARLHKATKDAWAEDRAKLEGRIRELEGANPTVRQNSHKHSQKFPEGKEDVVSSSSLDLLRDEISSLRRRCTSLETTLREVTGETEQLDRAMKAMANIRARVADQIRGGEEGAS
ncbi:uncharacterized protein HMPREF1541_02721 [Cyphellophora europaea CBS 101466]|uniref:Uncharacterized protein n=1 Tax=Cyphellophora europaea (strain CBS 101466) TaxID=1220924 RepID=W2S4E8_CYPE1|nr:uncharacterized protein HMPREF1541_02721 [Cyphellophora europaea CBS 101466]ETN43562.1 hypothetical protein HMPREF1541_02721 [Cyphellophora europaea CBS 101466]